MFSTNGSSLESIKEFEIKIENDIDQRFFLFSVNDAIRYDRPYSSGFKGVQVQFKYIEQITSIFDPFSFSLGGYSTNANIAGNFGPIYFAIPNVLLKISTQNLPSGQIERITEGFYQWNPLTPTTNNYLFNFSS
jgi:hypothetical protein